VPSRQQQQTSERLYKESDNRSRRLQAKATDLEAKLHETRT
jgi:hypothetical protein